MLLVKHENSIFCNRRIYLVRPEMVLMKYIADQINAEVNSDTKRSYKILFVPRKVRHKHKHCFQFPVYKRSCSLRLFHWVSSVFYCHITHLVQQVTIDQKVCRSQFKFQSNDICSFSCKVITFLLLIHDNTNIVIIYFTRFSIRKKSALLNI